MNKNSHKPCGYVTGATTGYSKLTPEEREALLVRGYKLDTNVHGDEIAKAPERGWFNSARFELHAVLCANS